MAQPYIGEIRMFGGNFAPAGWAFCDGQLMAIAENDALFALIGTTYGGDGQSTFALPDLRGRLPIHQGSGLGLPTYTLAEAAGSESVTLTTNQMPQHTHAFVADSSLTGLSPNPAGSIPAGSTTIDAYINDIADQTLAPQSVSAVGGSQSHDNMMPFVTLSFIISLYGIFPSQS